VEHGGEQGFTKQAQSRKTFHLEEDKTVIISSGEEGTVKKASLTAINATAAAAPVDGGGHTRKVFDEMPERCVSIFLSGKLSSFAVNLFVCSFAVQPRGGLLRWHAQRCIHRH
jgi:hypothetical protein